MAAKTGSKKSSKQQDFDDTNRGVLFMNDKGDNDARPDMTGNLAIKPDDYEIGDDGLIRIRLAAWNKNSNSAGDYLSISASQMQKKD
jgi:uncharacterized protein (DUF736 family)